MPETKPKIKVLTPKYFFIYIIIFLFVFGAYRLMNQAKQEEFLATPTLCESDQDCELYECSKCGNRIYLESQGLLGQACTRPLPGLVGCLCEEGVCKRRYER